jgi:hypothetical protein
MKLFSGVLRAFANTRKGGEKIKEKFCSPSFATEYTRSVYAEDSTRTYSVVLENVDR